MILRENKKTRWPIKKYIYFQRKFPFNFQIMKTERKMNGINTIPQVENQIL